MSDRTKKAEDSKAYRARMKANNWVEVKSWLPPDLAEEVYRLIELKRPTPPRDPRAGSFRRRGRQAPAAVAQPRRPSFLGLRGRDTDDKEGSQ